MRVQVAHVLSRVSMDDCISIDGKLLVWIDCHQDNSWDGKYQSEVITSMKEVHTKEAALQMAYRNMCRWFWTRQIGLWGCVAPPAREGNWGPWGHSHPPGCLGYGGVATSHPLPADTATPVREVHKERHLLYPWMNQLFGMNELNDLLVKSFNATYWQFEFLIYSTISLKKLFNISILIKNMKI